MKKLLITMLVMCGSLGFAQVTLGPSPYTQDFNSIGSGLPAGFTVRTGATASALGTPASLTTAATVWNNTSGAFKNFASATDLTSAATSTQQGSSLNRSLGVRQTGSLGDPGAAFVLQLSNTSGLKDFRLSFKLQSLDVTSPRQTTWRVDYGLGASPSGFTSASTTGTLTTGASIFSSNDITVDFGNSLDNYSDNVWIRIVTVTSSTGSGNRPSTAIDDFSLTYSTGTAATPSLLVNPAALAFGNQAIGTSSSAQSYTLSYGNLNGSDVTVSTISPFEISKSSSGPFGLNVSYTSAELTGTSTVVYARFSPVTAGAAGASIVNSGGGVTSPVVVSLSGSGVNLTPVAAADTYSGTFGDLITGNVASNDSDPQSLSLTYAKLTDPAAGTLTFNSNGTFSYQSAEGTNSTQTFTYRVSNTIGLSADATVTINLAEKSKIFISQYYEGASVNKWIELTNPTGITVNTASPQLKLALYSISGDGGNIVISGSPSQVVNLNITIPAKSSVLIGNTGNGTEVSYLTAASAQQTSNSVINFNGNDGVALLDATGNIIDAFGTGLNAKDVSYVRNQGVTAPLATFNSTDWTRTTLATVQNAVDLDDPDRLGIHVQPELPPCVSPSAQPSGLAFTAAATKSITFSFNASPDAGEYLIIRSLNPTLSGVPLDGTVYNNGNMLGGGTVAGRIVSTSFTDNNLASGTTYYYFIFALNSISCDGGPKYLVANPLSGSEATIPLPACLAPNSQPTNFQITFSTYNSIQGIFTPAIGADESLVIMSLDSVLTALPANQTGYTVGDSLGGGIIIKKGQQGTFSRNSLGQNTMYYFFVFALNSNCSNGPLYQVTAPLTGRRRTSVFDNNALNFYFGNLHSHSSYSDGNKDDLSKKPEDDYAFAKNSRNMDFLGLSEHNHTQAGMRLANWEPGLQAAKNATTSDFVALHGMEWGVISGGGHVIVYGIDSLIGWESGEHQIYVPKNTYTGPTGLFNIINRHGLNAIATLAHPNTSDFNNIAANYNALADSAVVGTALASGPAFSTNVTYSDPASSMSYLDYYNRMLARGYHLGASIDHDNHNMTFGRHTRARLVVLAPALTENDLLDGIKKMRFYASEDSAARVTFTINDRPVGSVFSGNGEPNISVTAATTSPVTSISIIHGTPGSGVTPTALFTSATSTLSFTDATISHLETGYYYADLREADGSRIITSPIWYTRNDSLKTPQVITFNALASRTYGDGDFDPAATSTNASIPVTYSSSDTTVATIVSNQVHILKAGSVDITAHQAGNTLYKPAIAKTQALTVEPKLITVTADTKTKEYGEADPSLTYTFVPALVGGDAFTGNISRVTGENAGTYAIYQGTLSLSSNYTVDFDSATLLISKKALVIAANNKTKVYGTTNPILTASYSGFISGEDDSVLNAGPVLSTSALANSPVGTYPIVASGAEAVNYAITYDSGILTINPASQSVTFDPISAKTYGDTDFQLSASGGASGNSIIYSSSDSTVAIINGSSVHIVGAGTTAITASQAGDLNYGAAADVQQVLVVNKAQASLAISNLSQTYDGLPKPVTITTTPQGLDGVKVTYNGAPTVPVNVGTYAIVASLTNANYEAMQAAASLTIAQPISLKVQYRNADGSLTNNEGKPHLKIVNTGNIAVSYNQLTARYWLTPENFTGALGMWIDYAQLGNSKITLKYVSLSEPRTNALGYIEYAFNASAGTLAAGGNSGEIQSRYANSDWSVFNEQNDYSLKSSASYSDNANVTLYYNGALVWGTEPVAEARIVKLKVYSEAKNGGANTISTYADIRNEGNIPVDFKDITARYWFTSEGTSPLHFWTDYAKIGNSAIAGNFLAVSPVRANADTYLELKVSPAASTFYPLTATGNIQYRISKTDWSNFSQSNDYSYQTGAMAQNQKFTLYYKGQLIFGTEPVGIMSSRTSVENSLSNLPEKEESQQPVVIYPNPSKGSFTLAVSAERTGPFKVTIFDSIGKVISSETGENSGAFHKDYHLSEVPGVYYLSISWKDHTSYQKIVID